VLSVMLRLFENWVLSVMLRIFQNWVLSVIFGSKRNEVTGSGENYIMKSLMICTGHPILLR